MIDYLVMIFFVSYLFQSVKIAYESMQPGHIYYASGELADASINRSPFSYDQNPKEERKLYV